MKTIIRHFSKLKKCIGKSFMAPINAQDSTLDETYAINEESIKKNSPAFPPNTMNVLVEEEARLIIDILPQWSEIL